MQHVVVGASESGPRVHASPGEVGERAREGQIHVLLIDDNRGDVQVMQTALAEADDARFQLETADRLSAGLARLAQGGVDIVLLDLGLHDSRGPDTLRSLVAHAPGLPVVALTSADDQKQGLNAVQQGAQDYLVKGRATGDLIRRSIRHALECHRLNRERRRAEEASRAKSEFLSNVTHEIRTPLCSMQNALSNIRAGMGGQLDGTLREYVEMLEGDCRRLCALVGDLLDMSRFDAGRIFLEKATLGLREVAQQVVQAWRSQAHRKRIRVRLEIAESTPPVYADEGRIRQVFTNLLDNAIKFTPEGGAVTIRAQERGEEVLVSVADTGPGIAPESREKIFDRFFQLDRQPEADAHGMGLGLSISREIVSRHGGRIWVESETAKGSTFLFTLPKAEPHTILKQEIASAIDRAQAEGTALSVLLVSMSQVGATSAGKGPQEAMLREVSQAMRASIRTADAVLPLGPDLVASILLGVDRSRLEEIVRGLEHHLGERQAGAEEPARVSTAFGVATYPEDGTTAAELWETARRNLCPPMADCGLRIADCRFRNAKSSIRTARSARRP